MDKVSPFQDYEEQQVDLGEVVLNYVRAGISGGPALLLLPGQSESWWGYREAIGLLEDRFEVYAVDLRGQGGSSRTPGRYTFDNLGNDLVRFIGATVGRPVVVSGNSSGGVLAAWLSAFGLPGQIRGAVLEDPPLFSGELTPPYGPSQRQSSAPVLELFHRFIGPQWSIGDWPGLVAAAANSPSPLARALGSTTEVPPQFREYDPEWSSAFLDGSMSASCPHDLLLSQITTPVLLTHHARAIDQGTGHLVGALSDLQATKVGELIAATGSPFTYRSFPDAAHAMHATEPARFADVVTSWESTLPDVPGTGRATETVPS